MSQIELFLPVERLFAAICAVAEERGARLVLQRFASEADPSEYGFFALSPGEDVAEAYQRAEGAVLYLSLGGVPRAPRDWAFLEREAAQLLELSGGRSRGFDLGQAILRCVAKSSQARPLFTAMKARLTQSCARGVTIGGQRYPRIYYDPALSRSPWRLWVDLETRTMEASVDL